MQLALCLIKLLSQASLGHYRDLQEGIQLLSEKADIAKKQAEEEAKDELFKFYGNQLSIQQQHGLEKELEGFAALALNQEAQALFEHILSWYRDMHVLLLGGSSTHLMNPDFQPELEQAVQRGDFKPLAQVYRFIEEAYLALQRSTSLSHCLENLFLKLDRVGRSIKS